MISNKFKNYFILSLGLMGFLAGCKKDFLKETLTTSNSVEYYNTEEGLAELVNGGYYQAFASPFNQEWAYAFTNYGTDEFHLGGDPTNSVFNSYNNSFTSDIAGMRSNVNEFWDNAYHTIGVANLIIEKAENDDIQNAALKQEALGSGYFFRAYSYLGIVSQYGAAPLVLQPTSSVTLEFSRDSVSRIYEQIISDFRKAYQLLPDFSDPSKLSKDAAAHYLAKAYLFRSSEINSSWNKALDNERALDSVVILADEVIAHHPLADNFSDLWAYTEPDGPNEHLPEIILSAQFNANLSTLGENWQHLFFVSRYDDLPQMQRDISGDRPYSRMAPTYYAFNVYDLANDSRFWKSFRTKHRLNNASGSYYENGDLGIMYVINQSGDTRFDSRYMGDEVVYAKTGKTIPNVYVAYPKGHTSSDAFFDDPSRFPSLSKFIDASRPGFNDTRGFRDITLARAGETYLLAAEAEVRLHKYQEALTYINQVRERASWKNGEDRSAYIDGGAANQFAGENPDMVSYMPENSYYESNDIAPSVTGSTNLDIQSYTQLPNEDGKIIDELGYGDDYQKMLCLVLDERSRELMGEYLRWVDLSRTKTLPARVKAFNPEARNFIKDFHVLRPIPQSFLDGIQEDGKNLTREEKQDMQNPGY